MVLLKISGFFLFKTGRRTQDVLSPVIYYIRNQKSTLKNTGEMIMWKKIIKKFFGKKEKKAPVSTAKPIKQEWVQLTLPLD